MIFEINFKTWKIKMTYQKYLFILHWFRIINKLYLQKIKMKVTRVTCRHQILYFNLRILSRINHSKFWIVLPTKLYQIIHLLVILAQYQICLKLQKVSIKQEWGQPVDQELMLKKLNGEYLSKLIFKKILNR